MTLIDWIISIIGAGAVTFLLTVFTFVDDMVGPYERN